MEACLSAATCPGHVTGVPALFFGHLITSLLTAQCGIGNQSHYPEDYGEKIQNEEEFDFIVVGSGSAGAVVASRLSENPKWKVLLLEAGGDPTLTSDIPAFLFSVQKTEIDWNYASEPQDDALQGMVEERSNWPRGKVLGGTSVLNAMLYVRGNRDDYDEWERLGNKGWGYDNVLKYFKKSQRLTGFEEIPQEEYDSIEESRRNLENNPDGLRWLSKRVLQGYHSMDGLLSTGHFGYDNLVERFRNLFFKGMEELGLPHVNDINGKSQIGITQTQATVHYGTRANTAKMFLSPFKDRPNLFISKNSFVEKVLIDSGKKAYGVKFVRKGVTYEVRVTKEVVISAGAVNSPQLLMLSGVGSEEELTRAKVEVVHNLKGVGKNLQDHLMSAGNVFSVGKSTAQEMPDVVKLDIIYEYLTRRTGALSSIGFTDVTGFINTLDKESSIPDLQLHHIFCPVNDTYMLPEALKSFNLKPEIIEQYVELNRRSHLLMIMPTLLRPKSVGQISLVDNNPQTKPRIVPNYLKEQEDVDLLVRGSEFVSKFEGTKVAELLETEAIRIDMPKCSGLEFKSREYWECAVRHLSHSVYHPVGTCKMGQASDEMAVVDSDLKVHGIRNLRVADASIMPNIVRGNTNAPSIMIGEKASDLIKKDWVDPHTEL